ncbi:trans-sialidase [Trypanosoma rangeli]|uniref:Trans-sialidase n=1 Tax=Trypanosoma rangeli TaxID=5698 RepID=A0A3R7KD70_TRYRA|nr:trans-sialidase [Trypanosoma rangeli]RNF04146.1 trans-sialidase [Trypanosoma rangeli]|eukprot:RNF04146.1 trans-sialidase [Trypanosoma rangeli]
MSRHHFLFAVLLLLCMLLVHCGSQVVYAEVEGRGENEQKWEPGYLLPKKQSFVNVTIELSAKDGFDAAKSSFRAPGVALVNGEAFVFAEAHSKDSVGVAAGIAAGSISSDAASASQGGRVVDTELSAYFPKENESGGSVPHVTMPTTITNGSTVYVLLGKYGTPGSAGNNNTRYTDLLLAKAVFGDGETSSVQPKKINWTGTYALWPYFPTQIYYRGITELVGGGRHWCYFGRRGAYLSRRGQKGRRDGGLSRPAVKKT